MKWSRFVLSFVLVLPYSLQLPMHKVEKTLHQSLAQRQAGPSSGQHKGQGGNSLRDHNDPLDCQSLPWVLEGRFPTSDELSSVSFLDLARLRPVLEGWKAGSFRFLFFHHPSIYKLPIDSDRKLANAIIELRKDETKSDAAESTVITRALFAALREKRNVLPPTIHYLQRAWDDYKTQRNLAEKYSIDVPYVGFIESELAQRQHPKRRFKRPISVNDEHYDESSSSHASVQRYKYPEVYHHNTALSQYQGLDQPNIFADDRQHGPRHDACNSYVPTIALGGAAQLDRSRCGADAGQKYGQAVKCEGIDHANIPYGCYHSSNYFGQHTSDLSSEGYSPRQPAQQSHWDSLMDDFPVDLSITDEFNQWEPFPEV